eukprot:Skav212632  [mRNA]  locus=scaffold173:302192:310846:+ [translate_table: standard]
MLRTATPLIFLFACCAAVVEHRNSGDLLSFEAREVVVQSGGGTTLVRRQNSLEDNESTDAAEASDSLEAELTKAEELRKEMKNATAGRPAAPEQLSEEERNWHWQELSNGTGANGTAGAVQKGNGTERNVTMELFNSSNMTQPREDWSYDGYSRKMPTVVGFAVLFLVELLVRLSIQRCAYFKSCWNLFDAASLAEDLGGGDGRVI